MIEEEVREVLSIEIRQKRQNKNEERFRFHVFVTVTDSLKYTPRGNGAAQR